MAGDGSRDRPPLSALPAPLAAAWQRVEGAQAAGGEPLARAVREAAKVTLRLLTALLLPDYLRGRPQLAVEREVEALAGDEAPGLGPLVDRLFQALAERSRPRPFLPDLVSWYDPRTGSEAAAAAGQRLTALAGLADGTAAADRAALEALLESLEWLAHHRLVTVRTFAPTDAANSADVNRARSTGAIADLSLR